MTMAEQVLFHTLGRTPAPATPATKDAGKDKKGRGDHCQPQEQCEPTKHNQSEPGTSRTVNAGFSIGHGSSLPGTSPEGLQHSG